MPPAIDLARRYAEAVAALRALHDFDAWLGQFWLEPCPVPVVPDASRSSREREDAIVWHEGEENVFGYLPDHDGCFCVPRSLALPDFPFAASGPALLNGQDVLISAAMREELLPPDS